MSCGVGFRRGSDPSLLWLWRRPVAIAPIRPLAWESPCAAGAALEKKKILWLPSGPDRIGKEGLKYLVLAADLANQNRMRFSLLDVIQR